MIMFIINSWEKLFVNFIVCITVVCLSNLLLIGQTKSEREKDELKGYVKSVSVSKAKFTKLDGKFIEEKSVLENKSFYDKSGHKIEVNYYNNKGIFLWKWRAIFDVKGNPVEFFSYEQDGSIMQKYVSEYNSANRKVKENLYEENKLVKCTLYKYSEKNQRVEEISYSSKGRMIFKRLIDYDINGNTVRESQASFDEFLGHGADTWRYEYDSKGNLTVKSFYWINPETDSEKDFRGFMGKKVNIYDKNENLIETHWYDSKNSFESKEKFDYEYDSKGNWVTRTTYVSKLKDEDNPTEIYEKTYRTINYW